MDSQPPVSMRHGEQKILYFINVGFFSSRQETYFLNATILIYPIFYRNNFPAIARFKFSAICQSHDVNTNVGIFALSVLDKAAHHRHHPDNI